jgi:hypothetical protein
VHTAFLAHLASSWVCYVNQNLAVFGKVHGHCNLRSRFNLRSDHAL